MALTWPNLLQFASQSSVAATNLLLFSDLPESRSVIETQCRTCSFTLLRRSKISVLSHKHSTPRPRLKCFSKFMEEKQWSDTDDTETVVSDSDDAAINGRIPSQRNVASTSSPDSLSLGIREPVYEVHSSLLPCTIYHFF